MPDWKKAIDLDGIELDKDGRALADCCGRWQTADMVYPTDQFPPGIQHVIEKHLGFLPEYLCDGHVALLHGEGLVRSHEMPGRR